MRLYYLVALVLAINLSLSWFLFKGPEPTDPRVLPPSAVNEEVKYSNILPSDYVGPETCAECHSEQYESWSRHPHHCMNQLPSEQSVMGDFDDARLVLPAGEVSFTKSVDSDYLMTVHQSGQQLRKYVVTRTVGSRYMQAYIGKQLEGPEPPDHDIYREHRLPFTYWFKVKRWFPRQYLNIHGDEKLSQGAPQVESLDIEPVVQLYGEVCMNCHNTYPYAYRIFHRNLAGFPDATVSAAIKPLANELSDTIEVHPSVDNFKDINGRLNPEEHLVTQGISCESCHFGGREHAIHEKEIRFLPTSKFTRLRSKTVSRTLESDRDNSLTLRGICTQCHSGNSLMLPNGAGKGNSREGLDLHAGFCASQISCVTCHDPHKPSPGPSGLTDQLAHIQSCTNCHTQYENEQIAQAHSGHPASAGVNCLDCHMPRYTRGIDELIRTHKISLPVEESMVAQGMGNACNACHLDKSTRWTLAELNRIWGRTIGPNRNWPAYEQLDEVAGKAWLHSPDSHMRLIATQEFARSAWAKEQLPELIRALNDPERINRVFAGFAVSRTLGLPLDQPLPVDIMAGPEQRTQQINVWLKKLQNTPSPAEDSDATPAVLSSDLQGAASARAKENALDCPR